ncbi:MAG: insulinase family protein [Bacteroides sp.]|nr:insulinase family protein [Bacteroides sp.]
MKQILRTLGLVALLICINLQQVSAQGQMPPIPMDKNVRIGKLDNGLTYYIRHNAKPEKRVEFYIAQKVGSIQEEPAQRGLAHFLEHMCFNGTKNFPGDERGPGIVEWCETKGIKFGANLNAYTSVDETVYNISGVPTENENVVDSCLLILHDWSNAVLLKDEEIDKERGVIHEEWRQRNSGIMRVYTNALPVLFAGTKFSDCMPIGSIDVIDNFPYQAIRDYYHKWYRPDLQGIIVVGDIDVDAMEAKIKKTFADIPAPVNAAERVYYTVGDNQEPLIYVGTDKEIQNATVYIMFKHDATPNEAKSNMMYMVQNYIMGMVNSMLNTRLNEIRQSANPPFLSAGVGYGSLLVTKAKDAYQASITCKPEGVAEAMKVVLQELERVRRYGFTATEYERARANYLQAVESAYNERANAKSGAYVDEYVRHFLDAEPAPGIEFEYQMMNQIVPNLPIEVINQTIQQGNFITENNQVVFVAGPEKEGVTYPTNEEIKAMLNGMKDLKVEPYVDKVSNEPLLKEIPQGGSIVSEEKNGIYGTTVLTLSNGVKVYLKPTDFKADEIRMSGRSWGGTSLYDDNEILNASYLSSVATLGGFGNHSKIELSKLLAGKKVAVSASVSSLQESVGGSCSPKDFETLMQLTYLTFTAPRKDLEAFASYKSRVKTQMENAAANPLSSFSDTISKVMYPNHPRVFSMQPEMLEELDYDRILEMYKERFADADDFQFYFVGNIDIEKVKPLIAQYIGALPSLKGKENFIDRKTYPVKGEVVKEYAKKQETPMATIAMIYNGKCKLTLKNSIVLSYLNQILRMLYTEEVREKEGGTYGVSNDISLSKYPKEKMTLQISYQTDPSKKDHLNKIIDAQLEKVATEGPSEEHIQKVKEYMLKSYNDSQKENGYWMSNLMEYHTSGIDRTDGYDTIVNNVTAKDIQKMAASLLKQGNKVTVIMTVPEAE